MIDSTSILSLGDIITIATMVILIVGGVVRYDRKLEKRDRELWASLTEVRSKTIDNGLVKNIEMLTKGYVELDGKVDNITIALAKAGLLDRRD